MTAANGLIFLISFISSINLSSLSSISEFPAYITFKRVISTGLPKYERVIYLMGLLMILRNSALSLLPDAILIYARISFAIQCSYISGLPVELLQTIPSASILDLYISPTTFVLESTAISL